MYCPNCNQPGNLGEKFCMHCGTPLISQEPQTPNEYIKSIEPEKSASSSNTNTILIGVLIAILALVILEITVDPMGILPSRSKEKASVTVDETKKQNTKHKSKEDTDDTDEGSTDNPANNSENAVGETDIHDALQRYADSLTRTTVFVYDRYVIKNEYAEYYSEPCEQGLFNYDIDDYDADGDPELLLLRLDIDGVMLVDMCETDASGDVYTAASISTHDYGSDLFHFADAGHMSVHDLFTYEQDGRKYICYEYYGFEAVLGDGWGVGYSLFTYDGQFLEKGSFEDSGSAYDEEDIPRFDAKIASQGIPAPYTSVINGYSLFSDYVNNPKILALSTRSVTVDTTPVWSWLDHASSKDRMYLGQTDLYTSCSSSAIHMMPKSPAATANYEYNDYYTSDYILPNSDTSYIYEEDLYSLSKEECRLARNEIYARHGRLFQDESLQDYFNQFDWYNGMYSASEFNNNWLNKYEKQNLITITDYEKSMGYN